jgi:hypothetical protein
VICGTFKNKICIHDKEFYDASRSPFVRVYHGRRASFFPVQNPPCFFSAAATAVYFRRNLWVLRSLPLAQSCRPAPAPPRWRAGPRSTARRGRPRRRRPPRVALRRPRGLGSASPSATSPTSSSAAAGSLARRIPRPTWYGSSHDQCVIDSATVGFSVVRADGM